LSVLVSKTRAAIKPLELDGRSHLRLVLPPAASVDVEAAVDALHRAESALARSDWHQAYAGALAARVIAARRFLAECDSIWVDAWRRRLDDVWVRASEVFAIACLEIGGAELPGAERVGDELIERAPFRESCYRLVMRAKAATGNPAEGLWVYERLRTLLRSELGTEPDLATQHVYLQLLDASNPGSPKDGPTVR
jgi:DNA-binding SARP family transcriptional activator